MIPRNEPIPISKDQNLSSTTPKSVRPPPTTIDDNVALTNAPALGDGPTREEPMNRGVQVAFPILTSAPFFRFIKKKKIDIETNKNL